MASPKGAMTLAEGRYEYKTDVSLILNNGKVKRDFVLRTCLDSLPVWKSKYSRGITPFQAFIKGVQKEAAIIDREVWVFGINAVIASDVVAAVQIGMKYFKVKADDILCDVYVKNLNAEAEVGMPLEVLVKANRELYSGVCQSIMQAAEILGCGNTLNFWVFSNSANPKIPKSELHQALKDGGAESITTDDATKHVFHVGDNRGGLGPRFKSNLHLASLRAL